MLKEQAFQLPSQMLFLTSLSNKSTLLQGSSPAGGWGAAPLQGVGRGQLEPSLRVPPRPGGRPGSTQDTQSAGPGRAHEAAFPEAPRSAPSPWHRPADAPQWCEGHQPQSVCKARSQAHSPKLGAAGPGWSQDLARSLKQVLPGEKVEWRGPSARRLPQAGCASAVRAASGSGATLRAARLQSVL